MLLLGVSLTALFMWLDGVEAVEGVGALSVDDVLYPSLAVLAEAGDAGDVLVSLLVALLVHADALETGGIAASQPSPDGPRLDPIGFVPAMLAASLIEQQSISSMASLSNSAVMSYKKCQILTICG